MNKAPAPTPGWSLLVISLPGKRATPRMRVWRALKALGAAVLRDGVYVLPDSDPARGALSQQAQEVIRAGGSAQVLRVADPTPDQTRHFHALFDRAGDYARILKSARRLKSDFNPKRLLAVTRSVKRLRRDFQSVRATDYFPGPATAQADEVLTELEWMISGPGEPQMRPGRIPRLQRKDFHGRVWATRARPWVDRLASAWLIRRFIDPRGRIVWLQDPTRCPRHALGFDFDGAAFSHVGTRVSFETLLISFSLEGDAALQRLGELVHYLDVGGVPVAEAPGIETLLKGARESIQDDTKLLQAASRIFDHLYIAYQSD